MKKVRAIITALVVAVLGVVLLTMNVSTSQDSVDLAEISAGDLENKTLYYAEDLIVMDVFATMEDKDVLYVAVMFEDEAGEYVVVNMPVNNGDAIWEDVNDYLDDYSQEMGDYVINCYVVTETNVNVDNKLIQFFDEWVDDFEGMVDFSVETNTEVRFNYLCDEDGDPYAQMEKSNVVFTILGVVCLALALVLLYFGVLRKPKAKKTSAIPGYTIPTYPTQPVQPANDAVNEQLQNYRSLVQSGLMTEEEFAAKEKELLNQ